jgi:hypothetical protein
MNTAQFFGKCQPRLPHSCAKFRERVRAGDPNLQLMLAPPGAPK